jgi:hypothetical protein
MRVGRPVEVTLEMAVANVRLVAERLHMTQLSIRLYDKHASFCARAFTRRWRWNYICRLAGVNMGRQYGGRPRKPRRLCMECATKESETIGPYCRVCKLRIRRQS